MAATSSKAKSVDKVESAADRPRSANAEMEITPAMIAAGVSVLADWERATDSRAEIFVKRLFRQMLTASTHEKSAHEKSDRGLPKSAALKALMSVKRTATKGRERGVGKAKT